MSRLSVLGVVVGLAMALSVACSERPTLPAAAPVPPGAPPLPNQPRRGDEIVIGGQFVHTGTPVVLWVDAGGYNAYTAEPRIAPTAGAGALGPAPAIPATRFAQRNPDALRFTDAQKRELSRTGWTPAMLRAAVDQFVLHYDEAGLSRECFATLCRRGLSVHFMVDLDGTIYQTLDVKEKAWHATIANDRSVGIEIANAGAYPLNDNTALGKWYVRDRNGYRVVIPPAWGDGGVRTRGFIARPARPEPVTGVVQNQSLRQFDFTPQQYNALAKLTAALCTALPRIRCDYPHDGSSGLVVNHKLTDPQLAEYHGLLGHFHIQTNKVDPGPAMQWDRLTSDARSAMR